VVPFLGKSRFVADPRRDQYGSLPQGWPFWS
jgi:hypothetical protein